MDEDMQNQLKLLQLKKSKLTKKISTLHKLSIEIVVDSDDSTEFEVRFSELKDDYQAINSCQNEIFNCMITLGLDDEIENEEIRGVEVEKMYFDILGTHRKLFTSSDTNQNNIVTGFGNKESTLSRNMQPQVKLPMIDLPSFNGNIKDWPHFKDMFQSLIHDNESLSDIEKFHYLVSCLKSEPLTFSKTLPITGQNYAIIWSQLNERYDNKRILASRYLEEILNVHSLNTESSTKLRSFLDLFTENVIALKAMTFPIDYGDFILCHIALQKLDKNTRQHFERKYSSAEFPTFDNLMGFLKDHCKALEAACLGLQDKVLGTNFQQGYTSKPQLNQPNNKFTNSKFSNFQNPTRKSFLSTNVQENSSPNTQKCLYCNNNHAIYRCQEFIDLSTKDRKEFIISKHACFNCLSHGHTSKACASRLLCKKCSRHHHTMLHESPQTHSTVLSTSKSNTEVPADQKTFTQPEPQSTSSSQSLKTHIGTSASTTLLGTAIIQVQDSIGHYHTARALCDPGSQVTFITKACATKLSLSLKKSEVSIQGISQSAVNTSHEMVDCLIKPCNKNQPCLQVSAIILDCITAPLPCYTLPPNIKEFYKNIDLADPNFDVPSTIDILIGADLFAEVFDGGRKPFKSGYPTPYKTIFGWVLIGKTMIDTSSPPTKTSHLCTSGVNSLDISLKKFWEVEEPPQKVHLSIEDQLAEQMFTQNTERNNTGRYVVKLPFRSESPALGSSCNAALHSFYNLESRLIRNTELREQYTHFMQEYEELGHMTSVDMDKVKPKYFIPHHEVFKSSQDGKSRQIRVVYNASAKTTNGKSLNDELLIGPKLQNDICKIISKFRLSPIVFTADIAKMYRQILVHPDHQNYQAILWRPTPQESIGCYLLNTVTYGVSSAPFLAIRTLQQLAKDEGQYFPLAANVLLKDIFVDDILTGTSSLENAVLLKRELVSLLKLGGFELKKWASNHPELLNDSNEPNKEITFSDDNSIKVLGIKWQPKSDCFSYEVHIKKHEINKRNILSLLSSIYDPLGWVTPTILWAKKLMQTLWTLGVDWDETLSEDIKSSWSQYVSELPLIESVQIPRLVLPAEFLNVQLHAFCDASNEGYGACLYLRSATINGISVNLVMAKSKVAPLKSLTIPKLELCAAVLLCKLVEFYCKTISETLGEIPIFAWTDSTVSLSWIRTSPHLLKTFVANRVATIQDTIEPSRWFYVPTLDNPSDCSSRGMLPSKIITHKLWWNGPKWLSDEPSTWPLQDQSRLLLTEIPETKSVTVSFVSLEQNIDSNYCIDFLERFSSLTRLKRITAWCLRFIRNCQVNVNNREFGPLSASELNDGMHIWISQIQNISFKEELKSIRSKQACKPEIQRLDPFIDEKGTLRVGGRLRHSSLQYSARHPILLPKNCHLTTLIIDHYHKSYFHVGPRTLQSLISRQFWITSMRNAIRKVIRKCVKCTKMKAKSLQPFMADLPAFRVNACRPFLKIGVDYGGPFSIKTERGKKPQIRKAYLCLFICLSTKAIHLELVSDISTDTFLAALNRLIARRGLCSDIYSDQGTNFIGAKNALSDLYRFLNNSSNAQLISSKLANKGISWHLNPPSAPHFGGIWEAGIKSAKSHLYRVIGDQVLTFEELSTFFIQVEAILNSRPLCPLSTDTTELDVLTPGHFLIGQPLLSIPQHEFSTVPQNRLSRWQLLEKARQHFWNRWSSEYLHTLQQRSKWTSRLSSNLNIGDVVIIKDSNIPPQTWRLGRILKLLPGPDGIIRVVRLQTANGEMVRPVIKLCPLPMN